MPIRIRCRHQPRDRAHGTEDNGLGTRLADYLEASHADTKADVPHVTGIKLIIVSR